jgi:hypothetical protein
MTTCKNWVGDWYRRRACQRPATGDDGLCAVCRGIKRRSMHRLRAEREYRESLRRKTDADQSSSRQAH